MELRDITRFLKDEMRHYNGVGYNVNLDMSQNLLMRSVKLGEEFGDFNSVLLCYLGLCEKEKLNSFKPQMIGDEASDLIIEILSMCVLMDVDIEEALLRKIEKMKLSRDY